MAAVRRTAVTPAVALIALLAAGPASAESRTERAAYRGVVTVSAAATVVAGDRLVLKLYHPGAGVDLDVKYRIIPDFVPPLDFVIAPAIDMSGRTRWSRYVVAAFIDRDGDVTNLNADEAFARTPEPLAIGTSGITLRLEPPPR